MATAWLKLRQMGAFHRLLPCPWHRPLTHHQPALMSSSANDGDSGSTAADTGRRKFDTRMLDVIGDPFTKKPLRYDAETHTLISDSLGVAFPINESGMPNLHPRAGRMLDKDEDSEQQGPQGAAGGKEKASGA